MAADGTITFSTALDNEQLEKDLKRVSGKIDSLKRKLEDAELGKTAVEAAMERGEAAMERGEAAIRQTEEEVERLRQRLAELEDTDPMDADAWFAARGQVDGIQRKIDEANARLGEQIAEQDRMNDKWQKLDEDAKGYAAQIEAATERQSALGAQLATTQRGAGAAMAAGMEQARAAMDAFSARIGTMVKRIFMFSVFLSALRGLRSALGSALMENERLSASVAGLKAAFSGVVSYVAGAVAPAITNMVNMAASAIMWLARLVDSVFGTQISAAIARASAAAQAAWRQGDSAGKAAKSLGKQAKATKGLGKEAQKATKSLLAFDEINALNAEDASDAADALGDQGAGMDAGDGLRPDWDALDVGKIDAKLAEIMLLLGAALMAVGAILAFSGINIPLGITLMAIGAMLIYAAYKEQWDRLPQQVRDAITGTLVLTGVVLLTLGAVLALSGANVAVGVGMMAAGALMLWTAAALNWSSLTGPMQTAVSAVLTVVSAALLGVGAVLAFSGANAGLGVALMALGAASMAAVAAINWARMPAEVRGVVNAIMTAVGTAALVLGAVLAFSGANLPLGIGLMAAGAIALASVAVLNWKSLRTNIESIIPLIEIAVKTALLTLGAVLAFSGANIPLGIALLVVGALSLAGQAAVAWDNMPDRIRGIVATIAGIVGGALVVLGVILCAAGVSLPIGLALIAAGAASMVASASVNWDYIRQKVAEVWAGIVAWWHSNVSPVFTVTYWQGVFKSIVNGLISCLNTALIGFGWFLNSISSGVGSILGYFGISGWSFSIGMPQIPYLAQGAVIPPNREFLAVLGDQRHGTNIEAPEDLLRQVVREEAGAMIADAIRAMSAAGNGQDSRDVVLMVGHTELARATVRGLASLADTGELGGLGIALT